MAGIALDRLRDNQVMPDRLIMERLVRREDAGRDFDIEFW